MYCIKIVIWFHNSEDDLNKKFNDNNFTDFLLQTTFYFLIEDESVRQQIWKDKKSKLRTAGFFFYHNLHSANLFVFLNNKQLHDPMRRSWCAWTFIILSGLFLYRTLNSSGKASLIIALEWKIPVFLMYLGRNSFFFSLFWLAP